MTGVAVEVRLLCLRPQSNGGEHLGSGLGPGHELPAVFG